jgi:AcrR family transcriptional regulator
LTQKRPRQERLAGIVEAALAEFLEKGYESSSMDSIARRAGLSKGGLYHHFRGKDEILLFANQKLSEPVAALMARAARAPSAAQALRSTIRLYLKYWRERPRQLIFFFLSMTRVLASAEVWDLYERTAEQTISFFQGILERGVRTGEFRPHDTRARAVALMSALDGVIGYLVIDRRLKPGEVARGFYDILAGPVLMPGSGRSGGEA